MSRQRAGAMTRGSAGRRGLRAIRGAALAAIVAGSVVVALKPTPSAPARGSSAADALATLRVGQWLQLEGVLGPNSTVLCAEVRVLTGDFLDDDWALKGAVQAVDATRGQFAIGGVRIQVTEKTSYESTRERFRRLTDLRPGMLVEVEGTYSKNRRFLAMELDDESGEDDAAHWRKDQILIVARAEGVDPRKRLISAMGFEFLVTDRTRLRSVIQ